MKDNILIVEDDRIVADDIALFLKNAGYEVCDIVDDGAEAIEKADFFNPDLVLVDIVLSGSMNGISAASEIIKKGVPVIFISAFIDEKLINQALDILPYNYILKPVNLQAMLVSVKLTIKRHRLNKWYIDPKTSKDLILTTDINGNIIYANPAFVELIGLENTDILGLNILSFIESSQHPGIIKKHSKQYRCFIKEIYSEVQLNIKRNDYNVWIGHKVQLIVNDGIIKGFQSIGNDITESKIKEYEMFLAKTVQDSYMNRSTISEKIHTFYYPRYEIGGDIIEIIPLNSPDEIGILIADVSGHGISAALVTALIKGILVNAGDKLYNPADLLFFINDNIIDLLNGYFVTAIYAVYSFSTGVIIYSNAGHYPFALIDKDKSLYCKNHVGVPLGVISNQKINDSNKKYLVEEILIEPGNKLLLFTDGVYEANSSKKTYMPFGEYELLQSLHRNRKLNGEAFIKAVFKELVRYHVNDEFLDDISMICIER